jgi:hypothetical protein
MRYLLLLCLLGCAPSNQHRAEMIIYTKDDRTGLCFASYGWGQDYGSFTNVPCSDDVMKQVQAERQRETTK